MSQVDTGLGWSANSDYLIQQALEPLGTVTQLTNMKPVPMRESTALPTNAELSLYNYLGYYDANNNPIYMATAFYSSGSGYVNGDIFYKAYPGHVVIILHPETTLWGSVWCWKTDPGSTNANRWSQGNFSVSTDSVTGLRYINKTASWINDTLTYNDMTYHATLRECLDSAVGSITPLYKYMAGYAVSCWVRWKNTEDTQWTGFLISTDMSATHFTTDGQTAYGYEHTQQFLYNGTRFYVTYVRLTGAVIGATSRPKIDVSSVVASLQQIFKGIAGPDYANILVTDSPDPWGDDNTDPGGGDGDLDNGDDVDFSTPPNVSAIGSGFLTLFTPDAATIRNIAAFMWSTSFDIDTIKKIFANPIDAILGLHIVPCATFPDGTKEIKIAGIGTGYSSDYTTHQYMPVDCGSIDIPKKWGSYLDYSPYTRTQIFLPYIGFRDIDIDDIQGKTVQLRYLIDILSGSCNAELSVPTDDGHHAILYSWAGQCAAQIPVTSGDLRGAISGAVSVAASLGAALATGGATAAIGAGATVAYNMFSQKTHIQRSGSVSGAGGFIAGQRAYIVRSQPNIALPAEQNKFSGYPSFVTTTLSGLRGYNEVESIHLENIPATNSELDEIETLLKGGVIF